MEADPESVSSAIDSRDPKSQSRPPKRRLRRLASLRTELIVPYIILTLLIAMVGTFVVTRLVTSSIRERFVNQMVEASRVAADGVRRQEQKNLAALRLLIFTEGVAPALEQADAAALQKLLLPLALNNRSEVITVIDRNGREALTLAYDPPTKQYQTSAPCKARPTTRATNLPGCSPRHMDPISSPARPCAMTRTKSSERC
jgi:hypothetical protein